MPIAVELKIAPQVSFKENYVKKLYDLFLFDLNFSEKFSIQSPQYVAAQLRLILEKSHCHLIVEDLKKNQKKEIKNIPLTGEISVDRGRVHQLADSVIQTLFNDSSIFTKRILFATKFPNPGKKGDFLSEIWSCDYDGENLKQLTNENAYSITPLFFPDRNAAHHFFYVCYKKGVPKIYLSRFMRSQGAPIIPLRGNQLLPAISSDGTKVAFISDASGRADLFLQAFDINEGPIDKPRQLYSLPGSVQASPSFSPDGNQLVFVSDRDGTPRLYLIDLKNLSTRKRPEIRCLTLKNRENTGPSWAPDGKKIAYSSKTDGVRQIWILDLENGEEIQLTKDNHHKENPCFASNSLHIVYNTTDRNESELYLVSLNNPHPLKITGGAGKKHYPSWEP